MTIQHWLKQSESALRAVSIATARLDSLVLLEDATGKDRAWLLAHPEFELGRDRIGLLRTQTDRRAEHTPLGYIRGKAEFYGREFIVNEHTLVPRPETETMIDLLKAVVGSDNKSASTLTHIPEVVLGSQNTTSKFPNLARNDDKHRLTLIDIGTGSGAIAVTAKFEIPDANVFATDIDEKCLDTAERNAQRLHADATFLQGNLLEPFREFNFTNQRIGLIILLCNLPYVPDNFLINTAATHEPHHALFGGPDGLDLYRKLFDTVNYLPSLPGHILTESFPTQHVELAKIARAAGYTLQTTEDFMQLFSH